ncbi:MAG TPA: DUF1592 domain-containing protein, partial [Polyangiales bacterium]|nr:DUF1592 domain-containing protein [Polyangiales bacterium]
MCRSPQSLRLLLALPCAALLACRATSEPGSLMCSAAPPPVAASSAAADVWKARRLSRVELARTFDALLGKVPASLAQLAQDDAENAAPASFEIDLYRQIAAEAAAPGARLLLARWGCAGDLPCLQAALAGWLESAFRGPLSDDERAEYFALLPSAGTERALRELLELVFQSPRFLYVIERGVAGDGSEARRELSAWELAARLSYLLWSQPPDDALREDARSGRLYEPAVLRAQALRLLHDPRAARTIGAVLQHWSAPELETLAKAANVYPEWDPQLREAMIEQFREFAALVLDKDYDFRAVLTTRWLPVDERLAGLSGTEASSGGWQLVESHEPRFGLLTLPGVLAANARADDSSP